MENKSRNENKASVKIGVDGAIRILERMLEKATEKTREALGDDYTFADYGIKVERKATLVQVLELLRKVE